MAKETLKIIEGYLVFSTPSDRLDKLGAEILTKIDLLEGVEPPDDTVTLEIPNENIDLLFEELSDTHQLLNGQDSPVPPLI